MTSKSIIRKAGKSARAEYSEVERAKLDALITATLQRQLDWAGYEHVMVYLPISAQREIDTRPLIQWIWATWPAVSVFVPRINGEVMEAVQISPLTTYRTGPKDIQEPMSGSLLGSGEPLDLVICPLLGFDRQGHRVGYGGGFYDRFFALFPRAARVGLGYEALFVSSGIPAELHDVRLHAVITEANRHIFS